MLYLKSSTGALVPLDTWPDGGGPGLQAINHYGQLPAVTISFNLKPGVSLETP
jgi:HAE1 family hydrophobic/amphiphilic exporter-1